MKKKDAAILSKHSSGTIKNKNNITFGIDQSMEHKKWEKSACSEGI